MDQKKEIIQMNESSSKEEKRNLILKRLRKNNFKLYKYCSFDENHNPYSNDSSEIKFNYCFNNVVNKSIFASKPSDFNDPFDCLMGVSTRSLLSDVLKTFLNMQYLDIKIDKKIIKGLFSNVANRYKNLDLVNSWPPSLIRDILNQFIKNDEIFFELLPQDNSRFVKKHPLNIIETKNILKKVFLNNDFKKSFIDNFLDKKFQNEENSKKLFDIFSNNDFLLNAIFFEPIKVNVSSDNVINDISFSFDKINMFSNFLDFNRVEEEMKTFQVAVRQIYDIATKEIKNFYSYIDNSFGITCFCKKSDDILMWSHYANKHTGFVIEYDLSQLTEDDSEKTPFLLEVRYEKTRPRLNPYDLQKFKEGKNQSDFLNSMINVLYNVFYVKSKKWDYEKEYRNIIYLLNDEERKVKFHYIKSIILGVNSSESMKNYFSDLCKQNGYNLKKYEIHEDEFKLVLNTLFLNQNRNLKI